eukprot:TRINITY_DN408_c0_g1_i17.p2 TRINITY_DN408_c0_g1~~TRINITY_DN408_c0_g1_i17.p2  ORF type:complete len:207 (+),score=61.43 TRINITY_DN408_c0_g1_i17:238-858(+)
MERSSGSMFARSQVSMSTVNHSALATNKIGEYAELGAVTRDMVKTDEPEFLRVLEGRAKENEGKLKFVDISKAEKEVEVKELKTLSEAIEGVKEKFPGLIHMRVPVCNSAAPLEADFDIMCQTLVGTSINTPVIINDQVGLSRATTASVVACLFKDFQINASFEGLLRLFPESILICSRWTDTQWTLPRILCSEENSKLSRPLFNT